ncbi:heme-binding protein 2-like isoform X1 [Hippoglossus hippoglossus]|uniref:heme-binding protein 2-like isoform X1 n=1 Tax=Hippoglossus hippoglossus TaxID=8267 RepID=UPI00148DB6B0|nr:heme-binding protein 2-like isoform X1 [Hippoglossus hippoglossus]
MPRTQHSTIMMLLPGLVGLLLVLTAEARVGDSSQLQFCTETEECLLFDPICQINDLEVRNYSSVKWVSTSESSMLMEFAAMNMFRRLFDYIRGSNDQGVVIDMTSPVLMNMPQKSWWQTGVFTMSFLLPDKYQKSPPKPTDGKVKVHDTPDMTVYVLSYSGWMTTSSINNAFGQLFTQLDAIGAKYRKDTRYAAGYNSPMTIMDRHNEVMVVVEGKPACPSQD